VDALSTRKVAATEKRRVLLFLPGDWF